MTTDLLDRLAALAQRDRALTTAIIQACREYAEDYPHLRYYYLLDRTGGGEWDRTRLDMATDGWPRLLEALGLNQQQEDLVVLPGSISPPETTSIFVGQGLLEYEELAHRLTAAWHDAGFDDNDGQVLASIWLFVGGGGWTTCQPGFAFPAHQFFAPGVSDPMAFMVARTGQLFQATAAALEYLLNMRLPKGGDDLGKCRHPDKRTDWCRDHAWLDIHEQANMSHSDIAEWWNGLSADERKRIACERSSDRRATREVVKNGAAKARRERRNPQPDQSGTEASG